MYYHYYWTLSFACYVTIDRWRSFPAVICWYLVSFSFIEYTWWTLIWVCLRLDFPWRQNLKQWFHCGWFLGQIKSEYFLDEVSISFLLPNKIVRTKLSWCSKSRAACSCVFPCFCPYHQGDDPRRPDEQNNDGSSGVHWVSILLGTLWRLLELGAQLSYCQ